MRGTKENQHVMARFTWVGTKKRETIFVNDFLWQAIDESVT